VNGIFIILDLVGDLFFILAAITANLFVGLYWWRSNWSVTPAGRITMAFMATIAVILTVAVTFGILVVPDEILITIRALLYGVLFLSLVSYLVVLLKAQRKEKKHARS
jgi:hypothetical protein